MKKTETKTIDYTIDFDNYVTIEYVNGRIEEVVLKIDGDLIIVPSDKFATLFDLVEKVKSVVGKEEISTIK